MKKISFLFVAMIATFVCGNLYAANSGVYVNSVDRISDAYKNYTIDFNQTLTVPAYTPKNSDVFLGEDITISWLPNENVATSIGVSSAGNFAFAPVMDFTKAELQTLGGYKIKQINNIQFSITDVSKITECEAWILVHKTGTQSITFAHTQKINAVNLVDGWNTAVLTTPYLITDSIETIWIGYMVAGTGPASPLNCATPYADGQGGFFIPNQQGSWSLTSLMQLQQPLNLSFLIKAGVTAEKNLPTNANLRNLNFPDYLASNSAFSFRFTVANLGSENITSMEVSYKLGNEAEQTFSITGISNMTPGKDSIFTSPAINFPASFQLGNTYPVIVTITKVSGKDDDDMSNNTLNSSTIVLPRNDVQRIVLHEGFTSSTCPPCVQGNVNLKSVQSANPGKFATIKYQMNWPGAGDPYYTVEGHARRGYYGVNSVPKLHANGINGSFWEGGSGSYTTAILNTIYAMPAAAIFKNVEANIDGKTVSFSAEVEPLIPTNANVRLFAAIIEKKTFNNKKTNGETEFENVMKKFLTPATGTPVGILQAEETKKFDLNWTFKGNYRLPADASSPINNDTEHSVEDFENLAVVYWVQNFETGNIYQSGVINVSPTSIKDEHISLNSIFPNPAKDYLTIDLKENATVKIFTLDGIKLFEETRAEGLSNINFTVPVGTYILRTETPKGSAATKFIVE